MFDADSEIIHGPGCRPAESRRRTTTAERDAPGLAGYLLDEGRPNHAYEFAAPNVDPVESAVLWLGGDGGI
jgi:hypothetical protein